MKILILGAGYHQVDAINMAKEMGCFVIACSYFENDPGLKIADKAFVVSVSDRLKILEIAVAEEIDAVFSAASDIGTLTAAYLSDRLGFPGPPLKSVDLLSNKFGFRKLLHDMGVSAVDFGAVYDLDQARALFKTIKKPIMIKPIASSGSCGVKKLVDAIDLEASFLLAEKCNKHGSGVLLEEFVDGQNYSGEVMVIKGEIQLNVITKKYINEYNVPFGHLLPARDIDAEMRKDIVSDLQKIIASCAIVDGPLNYDLIGNIKDLFFIEMGARLGGNWMPRLLKTHLGIDSLQISLNIACGRDVGPISSAGEKPCAAYIFHSERDGLLRRDIGEVMQDSAFMDSVVDHRVFVAKGDFVQTFRSGSDQLGYMIFVADSVESLELLFSEISSFKWIYLQDEN